MLEKLSSMHGESQRSSWFAIILTTVEVTGALLLSCWGFRVVHEVVHLSIACVLGYRREAATFKTIYSAVFESKIEIPSANGWRSDLIRHGGWIGSCLLFYFTLLLNAASTTSCIAAFIVALDSICSDLIMIGVCSSKKAFRCGNFGILLLDKENRERAISILRTMVRVTMMRGAQSGGVVTYVPQGKGQRGIRSRVVNGKRTDLSVLVTSKLWYDQLGAYLRFGLNKGARFYGGHTRFATSSKASFDGTHPHQWTPRREYTIWIEEGGRWTSQSRNVEVYICHNGDLDYWTIGSVTHPLEALFPWVERATHSPCPSAVDSACVAGIMDLLRTQGSWYHSVRFGFLFGPERSKLDYAMPTVSQVTARFFECRILRMPLTLMLPSSARQ